MTKRRDNQWFCDIQLIVQTSVTELALFIIYYADSCLSINILLTHINFASAASYYLPVDWTPDASTTAVIGRIPICAAGSAAKGLMAQDTEVDDKCMAELHVQPNNCGT